jgi:hypothetical protein
MLKPKLRTYIVVLACPDYRDDYDIRVKAHSIDEATDIAHKRERYCIRNCYLARETDSDRQQEKNQINQERHLKRLMKKKNQGSKLKKLKTIEL